MYVCGPTVYSYAHIGNARPAVVFDALAEASPLKLNLVKGLDILILRELTSGVYFGQPRGVSKINDNEEKVRSKISFHVKINTFTYI